MLLTDNKGSGDSSDDDIVEVKKKHKKKHKKQAKQVSVVKVHEEAITFFFPCSIRVTKESINTCDTHMHTHLLSLNSIQ